MWLKLSLLVCLVPCYSFAVSPLILDSAVVGSLYAESLELWGLGRENHRPPIRFEKISGPDWIHIRDTGYLIGTPDRDDESARTVIKVRITSRNLIEVRAIQLRVYSEKRAEMARRAVDTCQAELDRSQLEKKVAVKVAFGCMVFMASNRVPGYSARQHDRMLSGFLGLQLFSGLAHHIALNSAYAENFTTAVVVAQRYPNEFPLSARRASQALQHLPKRFWNIRIRESLVSLMGESDDIRTLHSVVKLLQSDLNSVELQHPETLSDLDGLMKWNFIESRSVENALSAIKRKSLGKVYRDSKEALQAETLAQDADELRERMILLRTKFAD